MRSNVLDFQFEALKDLEKAGIENYYPAEDQPPKFEDGRKFEDG